MLADSRVPDALQAVGLALGAVLVAETVLALASGRVGSDFLAGAVTSLPFVVGLVYGGRRLRRSSLSGERYPRVLWWCLGGLVGFVLINVAIMGAIPPENALVLVGWLRWAAALGGGIGLLVGVFEARSIDRAARAEREAVRAEAEESKRELLDDLNDLLRHEVLNASQVIGGYADQLQHGYDLDDAPREDARVIRERATDLADTIEEIRTLIDTTQHGARDRTVALGPLLREEVAHLRDRRGEVEIETDLADVEVRGGPALRRVFSNLLARAVEREDGTARVTVSVTADGTTAAVVIAVTDPVTSEATRHRLFVPDTDAQLDHGLRLSLVETLVRQYGGRIDFPDGDDGDDGDPGDPGDPGDDGDDRDATVTVELPRASGDDPADG